MFVRDSDHLLSSLSLATVSVSVLIIVCIWRVDFGLALISYRALEGSASGIETENPLAIKEHYLELSVETTLSMILG